MKTEFVTAVEPETGRVLDVDWKEGSQAVFATLGRTGAFVDEKIKQVQRPIPVAAAVRRTRHIHVDFVYRLIPPKAGRVLSTAVDVMRFVFFALAVGLTIQMMIRMGTLQMTIIDLPMNIIYGICAFGFAAAAVRSVQVGIENWRRGFSLLERPEHAIEETIE